MRKLLQAMMMVVSQVYVDLHTYQIVCIKHMHFFVYLLYLNKAV